MQPQQAPTISLFIYRFIQRASVDPNSAKNKGRVCRQQLRVLLESPLLLPLFINQLLLQSLDVLGCLLKLFPRLDVNLVAPLPEHSDPPTNHLYIIT